MKTKIDDTQQKLITFFKENINSEWLTLREIAQSLDIKHPQTVLNKLNQLVAMWLFVKEPQGYRLIKDTLYKEENDIMYIPIYGFAQCGNKGKSIVDEYAQEKIPVTCAFVWTSNIENHIFVRARGNSMEPKIQDGDLILIKQQDHYNPYDYVFVIHNQLPKLKKIIMKNGKLFLESVNRFFDDIQIDPYDETNIIGVVKKVIKNF